MDGAVGKISDGLREFVKELWPLYSKTVLFSSFDCCLCRGNYFWDTTKSTTPLTHVVFNFGVWNYIFKYFPYIYNLVTFHSSLDRMHVKSN